MDETPDSVAAELRDLAGRVLPHWRGYIEIRLDADAGNLEALQHARDWVRQHATIDGVPPALTTEPDVREKESEPTLPSDRLF